MAGFDFRLRFNLPPGDRINSDAEELLLTRDGDAAVRLRTGARDTPIGDHSEVVLFGGPYATESEANFAGQRAKRAVLVWAVRNKNGIDLGGRPPRSVITNEGLKSWQDKVTHTLRRDVHGIDVFEHVDDLVFLRVSSEVAVGRSVEAFVRQVAADIARPAALTSKQELAGELFASSFFDQSERSRFITLVTALEALFEPAPRNPDAQLFVVEMIGRLQASNLDSATKQSISGSVEWLKNESISQTGRALAARLLAGKDYAGRTPSAFFTFCYQLRSSIVHTGKLPEGVADLLPVLSTTLQFVGDLLLASFYEPQTSRTSGTSGTSGTS